MNTEFEKARDGRGAYLELQKQQGSSNNSRIAQIIAAKRMNHREYSLEWTKAEFHFRWLHPEMHQCV